MSEQLNKQIERETTKKLETILHPIKRKTMKLTRIEKKRYRPTDLDLNENKLTIAHVKSVNKKENE